MVVSTFIWFIFNFSFCILRNILRQLYIILKIIFKHFTISYYVWIPLQVHAKPFLREAKDIFLELVPSFHLSARGSGYFAAVSTLDVLLEAPTPFTHQPRCKLLCQPYFLLFLFLFSFFFLSFFSFSGRCNTKEET